MPQLSLKLKGLVMGSCMAITMSTSMSAVIILQQQGFTEGFLALWLQSTITALPFSFIIGLAFSTFYNKILDRFIFKSK